MLWARHVERMGRMRDVENFWSENLKGRHHPKDLDVNGK
jgi:hypothetical protein